MKKSSFIKILVAVFICMIAISCSYSSTYTAEDLVDAVEVDGKYSVLIQENSDEIIVTPVGASDVPGFIFYPGALVSFDAYLPMVTRLAARGFKCVIVNMPGDMAYNNISAAKKYLKKFPEVTEWYLSGHSLGGAMAATYISSNTEKFAGLVLLASFSTKDLSDSGLKVLSVYGTNDGVLNMESYEKYKSNLPADYVDYPIEGGNHAGFANYGAQKGDNEATIDATEQQKITVKEICKLAGL